jgi:hypothetical protein
MHRISLGVLNDLYEHPMAEVEYVKSGLNTSDVCTKALDPATHARHVEGMSML